MLQKRNVLVTLILFSVAIFSAFAQEDDDLDTEVVNVVKPYTPTISDAFKIKETPVLDDSITTAKREVKYEIFSVPVASTFTPAKGRAQNVERAKPIKLYDNYATLGFGSYTSILGELYSNFEISRTDNAGFFFRHNSAQGEIDGVRLENKYYDTQLDANYTSRQREATYGLEAGLQHQLFNWYGLNESFDDVPQEEINAIDPQQTYYSGYVGGKIALDDYFFEGLDAQLRYTGDAFSSSEFNITATPKFSFPLNEITIKLDGELDYLAGSFDQQYLNNNSINYSWLNTGATPSLVYINNDLSVSIGANAMAAMDLENSDTDFFIYPKINVSYRLVDEILIVYGGADGGLNQNTYYNFKEENPFVSPTFFIAPTSQLYDGFAGVKGKLSNAVGYNIRGSYGKEESKPLFKVNPHLDTEAINAEGFEYGNSFQVVYDDINTLNIFGELQVAISEAFSLGVNANYYSYDTTNEDEPWNLPELKATVFSNFKFAEKWYGGASLFYVGERKDQYIYGPFNFGETQQVETVTLDGYLDANVHLGYNINERFSVFAKGSNLLGDTYEKWFNYPVLGIQGLLGATYKFDW